MYLHGNGIPFRVHNAFSQFVWKQKQNFTTIAHYFLIIDTVTNFLFHVISQNYFHICRPRLALLLFFFFMYIQHRSQSYWMYCIFCLLAMNLLAIICTMDRLFMAANGCMCECVWVQFIVHSSLWHFLFDSNRKRSRALHTVHYISAQHRLVFILLNKSQISWIAKKKIEWNFSQAHHASLTEPSLYSNSYHCVCNIEIQRCTILSVYG